jgi:two-component system sensor histidine kinase HydH
MIMEFNRLVLVKRYLWGSLLVAIIPLALMAGLYDRYSSYLHDKLIVERIDGDLQTAIVKMQGFLDTQIYHLENLADLPEIGDFLVSRKTHSASPQLTDFFYLITNGQDVYGAEFFDVEGQLVHSIPTRSALTPLNTYHKLPLVKTKTVDILGPIPPENGKPGWFVIRKDVIRLGEKIGSIVLKVRLTSLTEQASLLYRDGVYQPFLNTASKASYSVLGTKEVPGSVITTSTALLPGWTISLHSYGKDLADPRLYIRYLLLIFVALSAFGIVALFVHMSERLAHLISPLNEGARSIANGDFSVRVSEDGPGEIRSLAKSFNEMSSRLNSLIHTRVDSERRAALGNLAAGIAHEVRNPLAIIGTTIHGLKRSEKEPARKEMLEVINEEIIRTDAIVEEFLDYARPREPKNEATLVRDVLNSVVTLTSATMSKQDVKLNLTGDASIHLEVDPSHLRQILMNIVLNSLDAMPNGGHLTIRTIRNVNSGEILIQDSGNGMDASCLTQAQTPFFTSKKGGTGLGLAICSQLISANGGTLKIESEVGHGTSVSITLPLVSQALKKQLSSSQDCDL